MNIWFATNNLHKEQELQAILNKTLSIPSEHNFSFNPEEIGSTFIDNALIKARALKNLLLEKDTNSNDPVISDDSGICVDGLDGRPGVLSARYGEKDGIKITSEQQNLLLLDELGSNPERTARFVCAMVLLFDENKFLIVQETLEGEIVKSKDQIKGNGGFGYDPIFFIPEFNKTLAELSEEEKNKISHRGKAGRFITNILNNI